MYHLEILEKKYNKVRRSLVDLRIQIPAARRLHEVEKCRVASLAYEWASDGVSPRSLTSLLIKLQEESSTTTTMGRTVEKFEVQDE